MKNQHGRWVCYSSRRRRVEVSVNTDNMTPTSRTGTYAITRVPGIGYPATALHVVYVM